MFSCPIPTIFITIDGEPKMTEWTYARYVDKDVAPMPGDWRIVGTRTEADLQIYCKSLGWVKKEIRTQAQAYETSKELGMDFAEYQTLNNAVANKIRHF